jgi:hypothetical protein
MGLKKDFFEFLRTKHIVTHFIKFAFEKKLNSRVLSQKMKKKKIGNRWFWEVDTYFLEGERGCLIG